MTDQKTIDAVTARLIGETIEIYESEMLAAFVVKIPNDPAVHSFSRLEGRAFAFAQARLFATSRQNSSGYPIRDNTV